MWGVRVVGKERLVGVVVAVVRSSLWVLAPLFRFGRVGRLLEDDLFSVARWRRSIWHCGRDRQQDVVYCEQIVMSIRYHAKQQEA